jgi:hypothetical protein
VSETSWDVRVAIMERMDQHFNLSGRVFDKAPSKTELPYVTMGPDDEIPARLFGKRGGQVEVSVHAWGRESDEDNDYGDFEVDKLARAVVDSLDGERLELPSHEMVRLRWVQTIKVPEEEPNVRHKSVRFRITSFRR